ncbi:hypothetical protein [Nonomuraea guangzhouensis]|uniref:Uncharacterized protein n=1 Tax=Nonomuraea guangzhouensis TaxID=1291555 RepID=A0ABW4GEM8_9ACTN|nr:hypothetical protein [Nonomuraea guangzhouensis]
MEPQQQPARHDDWGSRGPRRLTPLVFVGLALSGLALTWWFLAGRPWPFADGDAQVRQDETPILAEVEEMTPTPETDPSTGEAARQAAKLDDLLTNSHSARSSLSEAIARASKCEPDGRDTIQSITTNRRDQLTLARALDVTALPGGPALKESLVAALDASHEADAAFLSWARRHLGKGCTGTIAKDLDYRRGLDRSEAAQAAKARFAEAWRPIAETYDLTHWKANDI